MRDVDDITDDMPHFRLGTNFHWPGLLHTRKGHNTTWVSVRQLYSVLQTSSDATPPVLNMQPVSKRFEVLERHPHVRGRHPYAQLHAHSQLKR